MENHKLVSEPKLFGTDAKPAGETGETKGTKMTRKKNGPAQIIRRSVKDERGDRYFLIGTEDHAVWVSANELIHTETAAMAKIAKTGVPAMTAKAKNAIKLAVESHTGFEPALVVERPGWVRHDIYVHANGEVQSGNGAEVEVIVAFQTDQDWSQKGDLAAWQEGWNDLVPDDYVATTLLSFGFAPLLLDVASPHVINPWLQLVGPAESGKSTCALIAMSIYGGDPKSEIGVGRTWDMSDKALEEVRRSSNDALLFLDEESVQDSKVRTEFTAIFSNASSSSRARFGAADRQKPIRNALLSTANIAAVGGTRRSKAQEEIRQAAATRIISLKFDGPLLKNVPAGFISTQEVAHGIARHAATFYGAGSRAFVERMIAERVADEEGFRQRVAKLIERFEQNAPPHPHGSKRLRTSFGLIYAAGKLAEQWGILPSKSANVQKSVVAMYDLAEPMPGPSKSEQAVMTIKKIINSHADELTDLTADDWVDGHDVSGALGSIVRRKEKITCYFRSKRFKALCGPEATTLLKLLKDGGRLNHEDGKLTIKAPTAMGIRERVYCITLDA